MIKFTKSSDLSANLDVYVQDVSEEVVSDYLFGKFTELVKTAEEKTKERKFILPAHSITLWRISHDRSSQQVEKFVSKIRVHAIGHQDNTGPWIDEFNKEL